VGQWERVWMATKRPAKLCFYWNDNMEDEFTSDVNISDVKEIVFEKQNTVAGSSSVRFKLVTGSRQMSFIVQSKEKSDYWINGLKVMMAKSKVEVSIHEDQSSESESEHTPGNTPRASNRLEKLRSLELLPYSQTHSAALFLRIFQLFFQQFDYFTQFFVLRMERIFHFL